MDYQAHYRLRELTPPNDEAASHFGLSQRMAGCSRFETYRTDEVSLTSIQFGGGDWHWRLTNAEGGLLADCGGFTNRLDCQAAVMSIRAEASSAAFLEQDTTSLTRQQTRKSIWLRASARRIRKPANQRRRLPRSKTPLSHH